MVLLTRRTYLLVLNHSLISLKTKIAASFGLVALHDRNYHAAALKFLDCQAEIGATYNEVLHAEDIALYGGICALASFTRQELREKVRSLNLVSNETNLVSTISHMVSNISLVTYAVPVAREQLVVQGVLGALAVAPRAHQRLLLEQLRIVSPDAREDEAGAEPRHVPLRARRQALSGDPQPRHCPVLPPVLVRGLAPDGADVQHRDHKSRERDLRAHCG